MVGILEDLLGGAGKGLLDLSSKLGQPGSYLSDNRNALIGLGLGLASGNGWGEGATNALKGFMAGGKSDVEQRAGMEFRSLLKRIVEGEQQGAPQSAQSPAGPRTATASVAPPSVAPSAQPPVAPYTAAERSQTVPFGGGPRGQVAPDLSVQPTPAEMEEAKRRIAQGQGTTYGPLPSGQSYGQAPQQAAPPGGPPGVQQGAFQNPRIAPAMIAAMMQPNLPQEYRDVAKLVAQQSFDATKLTEAQKDYVAAWKQGYRGSLREFKDSELVKVETKDGVRFVPRVHAAGMEPERDKELVQVETPQGVRLVPRAQAAGMEPPKDKELVQVNDPTSPTGARFAPRAQAAGLAPAKDKTEMQARWALFGNRAAAAHEIMSDPKLALEGTKTWNRSTTTATVPFTEQKIVPEYLAGKVPGVTAGYRQLHQAERDFVNAILRPESGAVINVGEFVNANQQYFPMPGDHPRLLEQKKRNRELEIQGLRNGARPGYAEAGTEGAQRAGGPQPGNTPAPGNPSQPGNIPPPPPGFVIQ